MFRSEKCKKKYMSNCWLRRWRQEATRGGRGSCTGPDTGGREKDVVFDNGRFVLCRGVGVGWGAQCYATACSFPPPLLLFVSSTRLVSSRLVAMAPICNPPVINAMSSLTQPTDPLPSPPLHPSPTSQQPALRIRKPQTRIHRQPDPDHSLATHTNPLSTPPSHHTGRKQKMWRGKVHVPSVLLPHDVADDVAVQLGEHARERLDDDGVFLGVDEAGLLGFCARC